MSLLDSIAAFKTGDYTVTRRTLGTYDANGRLVPGTPSTFSISASIKPASGRTLKTLPEAYHSEEVRTVYTVTELKTLTPAGDGDSIAIDGEDWYVFQTKRHGAVSGGHTRALIARKKTP